MEQVDIALLRQARPIFQEGNEMSRPAVFAHPVMLTSPEMVGWLEAETGMTCQRDGALKVRMVPVMDSYEQVERDSRLSDYGQLGDAA